MSATSNITLEIDPEIQRDESLMNSIHLAVNYLEKQPGVNSGPLTASWKFASVDGNSLEFCVSEVEGTASSTARRIFPTKHIYDAVSREVWVLRVWADILSLRSNRVRGRVNQLLSEIDEDTPDGEETDR
jgi:hypothetical protein